MAYTAVKEVFGVQKFVRLRKKAQVTIPNEIVELLHLNEGDNLNIQVEDGRIVLVPTVTIAKDQAWFWTESWQQGERLAERDEEQGRLKNITDEKELDDFFDTLGK